MERRTNLRYRVWFPLRVVTEEGEEGTAITYDVSTVGLLMACPGSLELGRSVQLRFRVSPDEPEERAIRGTIVRLEPREEGDDGPWRHRMAVRFDQPQHELEAALRSEAEGEA